VSHPSDWDLLSCGRHPPEADRHAPAIQFC
jgi:hypothetical protein